VNRVKALLQKKKPRKVVFAPAFVRHLEDKIAVKFNKSTVLTMYPDGVIHLDTGGWRTPAIKARLNAFLEPLGWQIIQDVGIWYLQHGNKKYDYSDGVTIKADKLSGAEESKLFNFKFSSTAFIKKYVSEFVRLWCLGRVLPPTPGDPFNLYSKAMDHSLPDSPELKSYIRKFMYQNCYFGSLLMIAINDVGGPDTKHLTLVDKMNINEWLKDGKPRKSAFLEGTGKNIGALLRRYLYKVFKVSEGVNSTT